MNFFSRHPVKSFFICTVFCASLQTVELRGQSVRSHINGGNDLYKDQKFSDAEAEYRKGLEKDKEVVQGYFNLGDAMVKQQRFDEAVQNYEIALSKTKDKEIASKAYHNIGNALYEQKEYQKSINAYIQSLKSNPADAETKYNLAYVQRMMKQQQQQKQKQKQDQQKKDDKQDKKNQDKQQQEQPKQQQPKQQQQKQQQQQEKQISKSDAQRILEALKNDEKDVQKKLRKKAAVRMNVEKDW